MFRTPCDIHRTPPKRPETLPSSRLLTFLLFSLVVLSNQLNQARALRHQDGTASLTYIRPILPEQTGDSSMRAASLLIVPACPDGCVHGVCAGNGQCLCHHGYVGVVCDQSTLSVMVGSSPPAPSALPTWALIVIIAAPCGTALLAAILVAICCCCGCCRSRPKNAVVPVQGPASDAAGAPLWAQPSPLKPNEGRPSLESPSSAPGLPSSTVGAAWAGGDEAHEQLLDVADQPAPPPPMAVVAPTANPLLPRADTPPGPPLTASPPSPPPIVAGVPLLAIVPPVPVSLPLAAIPPIAVAPAPSADAAPLPHTPRGSPPAEEPPPPPPPQPTDREEDQAPATGPLLAGPPTLTAAAPPPAVIAIPPALTGLPAVEPVASRLATDLLGVSIDPSTSAAVPGLRASPTGSRHDHPTTPHSPAARIDPAPPALALPAEPPKPMAPSGPDTARRPRPGAQQQQQPAGASASLVTPRPPAGAPRRPGPTGATAPSGAHKPAAAAHRKR
ncbi:hypothetical protein PAPYR_10062 [Paratrimastix pyriformis]|uniref:EGF-like domain-containing protein n=1 Tax=Paratrimastix pyriformis TaxID=342808 RepID=A0ABQ8U9L1_9EUKA|nr:hypothetical protein PAPYR_10062 [Paratrimastix pyriformis]